MYYVDSLLRYSMFLNISTQILIEMSIKLIELCLTLSDMFIPIIGCRRGGGEQ